MTNEEKDNEIKRLNKIIKDISDTISFHNGVHVCEGGGPEDVVYSVAVTLLRQKEKIKQLEKQRNEAFDQLGFARQTTQEEIEEARSFLKKKI